MLTIRHIDQSDKAAWLLLWNQYLDFYQEKIPAEVTEQTMIQYRIAAENR